jgi:hypothetical protein
VGTAALGCPGELARQSVFSTMFAVLLWDRPVCISRTAAGGCPHSLRVSVMRRKNHPKRPGLISVNRIAIFVI